MRSLCQFLAPICGIALVLSPTIARAQDAPIVRDAEYRILERQHGERWTVEDKGIDVKLAEFREKNGGNPPNILYILLDDIGFGEVGMPDLDVVRGYSTPNITDFAEQGMSMMRMYTEPSCTPTRVAMLTGRHPVRTGFDEAKAVPEGEGLADREVTLAEVLSENGYATAHIGKWHMGDIEQSYAINQGFDYAEHPIHQQAQLALMSSTALNEGHVDGVDLRLRTTELMLDDTFRIDPYAMVYGTAGEKGGTIREVHMESGQKFSQDDYVAMGQRYKRSTLEQLEKLAAGDKPFFLQYWPLFPISFTRTDIEQAQTLNGGPIPEAIVKVDGYIGEILDRVEELGIADSTIIVIMGDNGPFMEFVDKSGQSDRIYRGGKTEHLEGGVRVNAYVRWPGMIEEGSRVKDITHVSDLFSTFARLGDGEASIPRDRIIDGVDQTALWLLGETHGRRDYVFVYEGFVLRSLVKQQYKMHLPPPGGNPILAAMYDLYKNPREDRPQDSIRIGVGFGANFSLMAQRHLAMKELYPDMPPGHGPLYGGIENLRPETKELVDNILFAQGLTRKSD
ncbi:sulfatase-like hydrolase/transferase [Ruegeria sp. 6PALISEP08]|uniref:sulfatase-like hydrolase/transferase n=1 Tax=Ruegeria sp. 6PALISEP08 TaxID=1225660 RepID=UPI00067ECA01|nr:sulfatase-like hydrolase/transferase [Ruegeria sp. 6PALISEP08]